MSSNGIPFGGASRVMRNGERQAEGVRQLRLKFSFPRAASIAVASASVAEDEDLAGCGVAERSFLLPPMGNGMSGKGRCVVRDADNNGASVRQQVVDAIGDGDAGGIGTKVVIVDQTRG